MIFDEECKRAGVDPKHVSAIAKRIERACYDANKLGITVFMGSNSTLRFNDGHERPLILADLKGSNLDGGDGAYNNLVDGFHRGE